MKTWIVAGALALTTVAHAESVDGESKEGKSPAFISAVVEAVVVYPKVLSHVSSLLGGIMETLRSILPSEEMVADHPKLPNKENWSETLKTC